MFNSPPASRSRMRRRVGSAAAFSAATKCDVRISLELIIVTKI